MAKFEIYEILYDRYIKEFNLLNIQDKKKYGSKDMPLCQDDFNERLETDLDFNNRWYDKI